MLQFVTKGIIFMTYESNQSNRTGHTNQYRREPASKEGAPFGSGKGFRSEVRDLPSPSLSLYPLGTATWKPNCRTGTEKGFYRQITHRIDPTDTTKSKTKQKEHQRYCHGSPKSIFIKEITWCPSTPNANLKWCLNIVLTDCIPLNLQRSMSC